MAADNTMPLRDCLESLPQEIYDEIYSLTFTPDASAFLVNNRFQAPKMSQVDATSAAVYFSRCTFVGRLYNIVKWLQHTEHTPPISNSTIRCYLWEDLDRSSARALGDKFTIGWSIEVEDVEDMFGEGCCLNISIYRTREEALQGLKVS